jgi:general secretion pathway protein J
MARAQRATRDARGRRDPEAGVTLIEVLVAMALFAVIGVSAFSVLDTIIRVRTSTEARLERIADIDRTLLILTRDLNQKGSAPVASDGTSLSFSRWDGLRLVYAAPEGVLIRRLPALDTDQRLLAGAGGLTFRLLDTKGVWHDEWPVIDAGVLPQPALLRAVEMSFFVATSEAEEPQAVIRLVDLPQEIRR